MNIAQLFHYSLPLHDLHFYSGSPRRVVFITIQIYLFVFSFAFSIKIHMLTIQLYSPYFMHHIIKSSAKDAFIKWNFFKANGKESKITTTNQNWKSIKKNPQGISKHKMNGFVLHIIKFCVNREWTLNIRVQISYRLFFNNNNRN